MPDTTQIVLRAARDRVVDLLSLGETYPLQDTPVSEDHLTVAVNVTAKVIVSPGQPDVTFELRDRNDKTVSDQVRGTGTDTVLTTPPIKEDSTFRIFASKIDVFASGTRRQAYLNQTAEVKVGLDTSLRAYIDALPLNAGADTPAPTDPRIADYGANVHVKIDQSQEAVDYTLVVVSTTGETVVSQQAVRGNLSTIVVTSTPVQEDTEIRVRATRKFDPSEGRTDETALLDARLPLMVRANTALAVSVQPAASTAYRQNATIVVAGSQTTARYRPYLRTLADSDFVYGTAAGPGLLPVAAGIQVPNAPYTASAWVAPDGFAAVGDAQPGTGSNLSLTIPALIEDCLVIVQASKEHGAAKIPSSVQLQQASLVLVQPDASPALALEAPVQDGKIPGTLLVTGGQPGIFYYFRVGDQGAELLPPAYFHKLDSVDQTANKGLGQLRMEIDFVLARDQAGGVIASPAHTPPPPPLLELGAQPSGVTFSIRAMKARTEVSVALAQKASIPATPAIKLDQTSIPSGASAKIVVTARVLGENYQPFLSDGTPVVPAQDGNGSDLSFLTGPLTQDTTFLMRVRLPAATGIPVTRTITLTATVQPHA